MGEWAGFSTGWLYWYFWVIVVGFEAVVGGQMINKWIPSVPVWVIALGLMVIMTGINLLSVGAFGEAEYWFASIKVVAIIVFMAVCGLFVFGLWPGASADSRTSQNTAACFEERITGKPSRVAAMLEKLTGAH